MLRFERLDEVDCEHEALVGYRAADPLELWICAGRKGQDNATVERDFCR